MAIRAINPLFSLSTLVRAFYHKLRVVSSPSNRSCPFVSQLVLSYSTSRNLCRYCFHGKALDSLVRPFSTNTTRLRASGTHSDPTDTAGEEEKNFILIPDPPTNCCMSGCANCVWLTYAQELLEIYKDGGQVAQEVLQAIEDPSLKVFLNIELREVLKEINNH